MVILCYFEASNRRFGVVLDLDSSCLRRILAEAYGKAGRKEMQKTELMNTSHCGTTALILKSWVLQI